MNDQPAIIARYHAAQAVAGKLGFQLAVMRRGRHIFVLKDQGASILTCDDIANVDAFLRGVRKARERQQRAKALRRTRNR